MATEHKQSSSNSSGNTIDSLTSIMPPKGYDYVELVYKYGKDGAPTAMGFPTDETSNETEYTIDKTSKIDLYLDQYGECSPILAALSKFESHIVHGLRVFGSEPCLAAKNSLASFFKDSVTLCKDCCEYKYIIFLMWLFVLFIDV